jgi:hypothetical protein
MENGIYYYDQFLEMDYEELCDLFACYRDSYTNSTFHEMRNIKHNNLSVHKAQNVFGTLLPMTDY